MAVKYLSRADAQRLVEHLSDGKSKFSSFEEAFKDYFPKESFYNVSKTIQQMINGLIATPEGIGLVSSFFILDLMCKTECETAKSVFYAALLELERSMRQDLCFTEQIKYASKESKEGKKANEASHSEKYRLHCVAKEFAFRLLSNRVAPDETPLTVLLEKQEQVDAALTTWENNAVILKEPLAGISHCWTLETEKNTCETLAKNSAPFNPEVSTALTLQIARPQLPSLPLTLGELQFLLPGTSSSAVLLFDSEPATEDWITARKLVTIGCEGALTKEQQQQLIQSIASGNVFNRIGMNSGVLSRMAVHNPDVCAALILKLPPNDGSLSVQHLLKSSIPPDHLETVLLRTSKILQQVNLRAYITGKVQLYKEKKFFSSSDRDAVKNFITTLHQLVTKVSKDNKEMYIADVLRNDISELCERCNLPEVTARWEELK